MALELADKERNPSVEDSVQELNTGEVLEYEDIYLIAATEESYSIALLGGIGSGKTTLITSLYQMFLVPDKERRIVFGGSKTLQAFEERAFYTRTKGRSSNPLTPRTQLGSLKDLLHLRVYLTDSNEHINLFLTDSSGEEFQSISGNTEIASRDFPIIRLAKHISIVLDGEKLAAIRQRYAEIQRGIQLLKTFIDADSLRRDASISIIVTKYDLFKCKTISSQDELSSQIKSEFLEQIPEIEGRLTLFVTAAMPNEEGFVDQGYGLRDLLTHYVMSWREDGRDINRESKMWNTNSQFDLWKDRVRDEN